jgi:hypothetical protein
MSGSTMAKGKKNTGSTLRRKRYSREVRLQMLRSGFSVQYTGKNIVKGYNNWYGVELT